jgi:hypothetical protein
MNLTRRRFIAGGLALAVRQWIESPINPFSILSPKDSFAGQFYAPYDERLLSNISSDVYRLVTNLKFIVRKSIYPIKTSFTWQPTPKTPDDSPAWIHGTRRGIVTIVSYREKLYALSVSHLVVPTARDLHQEKIALKEDMKVEMFVGNNNIPLEDRVVDQMEEIAIFKIPESLPVSVKPLVYSFGDLDKLELGDMIVVVAPRDVRIGSVIALHGEEPMRTLELGTPKNTFLTDIPVLPGFSGSLGFAFAGSTPYIVGLTEGFYIKRHKISEDQTQADFRSVIIRIDKFKELIEEKLL